MRKTRTPVTHADVNAFAPLINEVRLEQVFALPFVEISTLAPPLARAISEAYHLAMTMIDTVRLASGEVRVALAKVVAFVAQARLRDNRGVIDTRGIERLAKEAIDILSGLRPLPAV